MIASRKQKSSYGTRKVDQIEELAIVEEDSASRKLDQLKVDLCKEPAKHQPVGSRAMLRQKRELGQASEDSQSEGS